MFTVFRQVAATLVRKFSSSIKIEITELGPPGMQIARLLLEHPPVNSLDTSFIIELNKAVKEIEDSKDINAVIIKSSLPGIFSAGLDLNELCGTSREHVEKFWELVQNLWLQIYSSRLITLACITGHCLAAGVIVAGACDYRIGIKGQYSIGITAAKIGLVAPPWCLWMLSHIIGERKTEYALQVAHTFSPEEAIKIGFFDKLCSADQVDSACIESLKPYLAVSQDSRVMVKHFMRSKLIKDFNETREKDKLTFVDFVMKESVQEKLTGYIQRIKN